MIKKMSAFIKAQWLTALIFNTLAFISYASNAQTMSADGFTPSPPMTRA